MLDNLGKSLRQTLKKVANASNVDKNLIKEVVREVQRALLQADINVKLVSKLSSELQERALTERPPPGMSNREHVVKIIYEELVGVLGEEKELEIKPQTIMMVGLYGQGKTTTCGKLAKYFQKRGLKVAMIAGDVHRPAAYDQLSQLGEKLGVQVFGIPGEKKAGKIVRKGLEKFKDYDIQIIDTSGRHALENDLIEEIKTISNLAKPDQKLLIMDATIGQQAGPQAKAFHEAVGVTGVIITKMDGSAKGGGAISAVAETEAPAFFVGTGEHIEDLEKFNPPRFLSRMLGMGDLQSLLEKAQDAMKEEDAEEIAKKMMSGKFTLREMRDQMDMLGGMGPLKKLMSMLPGFSDKIKDTEMEQSQERIQQFKVIMNSMTDEELDNPQLIKSKRIERISRGSGTTHKDVKALLKQYNMSKKAVKGMVGNRKIRKQLEKQFSSGNFSMPGM